VDQYLIVAAAARYLKVVKILQELMSELAPIKYLFSREVIIIVDTRISLCQNGL
jgi:hypothetical protein